MCRCGAIKSQFWDCFFTWYPAEFIATVQFFHQLFGTDLLDLAKNEYK